MRADLAARLRRTMRGETIAEYGVAGVGDVTGAHRVTPQTPAITPVTPVTPRKWQWGKERKRGRILAGNGAARGRSRRDRRARGDGGRSRAGLLSRRMGAAPMPAAYIRCRRRNGGSPSMTAGTSSTPGARTQRRCDGRRASCSTCRADGLAGGLVWQLKGERVRALGEERARLTDRRTIKRLRP